MAAIPGFFQYSSNIWILDYAPLASGGFAYRREVARVLDLIRGTHSGRTLFRFINLNKRGLFIRPFQPTPGNPVNAAAQAVNARDATRSGTSTMRAVPSAGETTIMLPTGSVGTGAGTMVRLFFHPANAHQVIVNKGGKIDPGDGAGEKLFHEMVHALRMLEGIFSNATIAEGLTDGIHMDDEEEFCAIAAQNVYRSERGFKQLRKDHHGHNKLGSAFEDSESYYEEFKDSFADWFNTQESFCLELANVKTKFNPFVVAAYALGKKQRDTHVTPMAHR